MSATLSDQKELDRLRFENYMLKQQVEKEKRLHLLDEASYIIDHKLKVEKVITENLSLKRRILILDTNRIVHG